MISDGKKSLVEFAEIASHVHPFVTFLHIREKDKTVKEVWEGTQLLLERGIPKEKIIINDRVDAAAAAGVKGVQLAYHSLEPKWVKASFPHLRVGRSVHSAEEAKEMEQQQADFLIYGHIYSSGSKPGLEARGTYALSQVVQTVRIPVIAIGGINPERVPSVLQTGAAGIAVMSGILNAADPVAEVKRYVEALRGGVLKSE